jgi:ubiquinone/menaquinone biosynthesis C-methylase UbiE
MTDSSLKDPSRSWTENYKSGAYRSMWDHSFPSPELVGFMFAMDQTKKLRIVDIGCGAGRDAVFLASLGHDVDAVDFSAEALKVAGELAQKANVKLSLHQCSALQTPFDDHTFDFITDRGCFHHIYGEDRKRYGAEMARILKPGGTLLLRGSNRSYPKLKFSPVNDESLALSFPTDLFDLALKDVIWLTTDAGGVPVTIARLVRKG